MAGRPKHRPKVPEEDPLNQNEVHRTCVVCDAANLLNYNVPVTRGKPDNQPRGAWREESRLSASRLSKIIDHLESKGWHVCMGLKTGTYEHARNFGVEEGKFDEAERDHLLSLVDSGRVSLINKKDEDSWIIKAAIEYDGWLISNDYYRNWKRKHPDKAHEIDERLRGVEWVGDLPVINIPPYNDGKTIIDSISDYKYTEILSNWVCKEGSTVPVVLPLNENIGREILANQGLDSDYLNRISREHFQIMYGDGMLTFFDKGSTNGTYVNGVHITGECGFSVDSEKEIELILGNPHNKMIIYPQFQEDE